jgi:hypothetical protein
LELECQTGLQSNLGLLALEAAASTQGSSRSFVVLDEREPMGKMSPAAMYGIDPKEMSHPSVAPRAWVCLGPSDSPHQATNHVWTVD